MLYLISQIQSNVHPKSEGCAVVSLHPDVYSLRFSALGNRLPLCLRKGESVQRNIYIDSSLVILPTPGAHRSEAKLTSLPIRLIFPSTRSIRIREASTLYGAKNISQELIQG